jgi:serine/threonine protein phosphatase 1
MNSRIIIADVHGCYKTLVALIAKLPPGIPITFAGDNIDRGRDSRKVIEFVKDGGYDCVVGNHEVMMMNELKFRPKDDGTERPFTDTYHGIWEMNGGDNCLESYRYDAYEELVTGEKIKIRPYDTKALREHLAWFNTLPYFIEYKDVKNANGDYLLVTHTTASGAWEEMNHESSQFRNEVTWNRPYGHPPKIEGIYNVFGHTPQKNGATVHEHYSCIDTGCYFKRGEYGRLTALQFPEMIVYEQENVE